MKKFRDLPKPNPKPSLTNTNSLSIAYRIVSGMNVPTPIYCVALFESSLEDGGEGRPIVYLITNSVYLPA